MRVNFSAVLVLSSIIIGANSAVLRQSVDNRLIVRTDDGDGGEKSYSEINEVFTNVMTSAGVWKAPIGWGAFMYGTTEAAGQLMNACNYCWTHHRNLDGNCAIDLSGLARALGVAAFGITTGVLSFVGKRDINAEDLMIGALDIGMRAITLQLFGLGIVLVILVYNYCDI